MRIYLKITRFIFFFNILFFFAFQCSGEIKDFNNNEDLIFFIVDLYAKGGLTNKNLKDDPWHIGIKMMDVQEKSMEVSIKNLVVALHYKNKVTDSGLPDMVDFYGFGELKISDLEKVFGKYFNLVISEQSGVGFKHPKKISNNYKQKIIIDCNLIAKNRINQITCFIAEEENN